MSIPDGVEELCDEWFCECESLLRVTFGASPSLNSKLVFCAFGVREIHIYIPDSVAVVVDELSLSRSWDSFTSHLG